MNDSMHTIGLIGSYVVISDCDIYFTAAHLKLLDSMLVVYLFVRMLFIQSQMLFVLQEAVFV